MLRCYGYSSVYELFLFVQCVAAMRGVAMQRQLNASGTRRLTMWML